MCSRQNAHGSRLPRELGRTSGDSGYFNRSPEKTGAGAQSRVHVGDDWGTLPSSPAMLGQRAEAFHHEHRAAAARRSNLHQRTGNGRGRFTSPCLGHGEAMSAASYGANRQHGRGIDRSR
jgi:hypothetical protein